MYSHTLHTRDAILSHWIFFKSEYVLSKAGISVTFSYLFFSYFNSRLQTANKSWKNAVRHGLIMGNWFKKLDNPNNHKACLWSFHPTSFGAIQKQVFKMLGSLRAETEATMAFPQFLNCILEGVIKPSMVHSLFKFQEALKKYWEKSGRTPQLRWWHENAPWMPNGSDRRRKLHSSRGNRGFETPVHAIVPAPGPTPDLRNPGKTQ